MQNEDSTRETMNLLSARLNDRRFLIVHHSSGESTVGGLNLFRIQTIKGRILWFSTTSVVIIHVICLQF